MVFWELCWSCVFVGVFCVCCVDNHQSSDEALAFPGALYSALGAPRTDRTLHSQCHERGCVMEAASGIYINVVQRKYSALDDRCKLYHKMEVGRAFGDATSIDAIVSALASKLVTLFDGFCSYQTTSSAVSASQTAQVLKNGL